MKIPFLLVSALFVASSALATVSETVDKTYPLAADGIVSLENVNGDIEIIGWDKNEVHIVAEKRARNDEDLQKISIRFSSSNWDSDGHSTSKLSIKTEIPKAHFGFLWFGSSNVRGEVRYKLMVPFDARLEKIDVVNSDITVRDVRGPVNLDTVNGRIRATGLAAAGRFDTVNGSINVSFDSVKNARRIVLDTVNGSCTLRLPPGAGGHVNADTVNGRISCDFPIRLDSSGRHSLRGVIGDGEADIVLDSVNGSLRIEAK